MPHTGDIGEGLEKKRRTTAQMLDLKKEFEKSQLTVLNFSRLHRISSAILYKWKNASLGNTKKMPGFSRLKITEPSLPQHRLFAEVNGIRIYQQVSASFLKELL